MKDTFRVIKIRVYESLYERSARVWIDKNLECEAIWCIHEQELSTSSNVSIYSYKDICIVKQNDLYMLAVDSDGTSYADVLPLTDGCRDILEIDLGLEYGSMVAEMTSHHFGVNCNFLIEPLAMCLKNAIASCHELPIDVRILKRPNNMHIMLENAINISLKSESSRISDYHLTKAIICKINGNICEIAIIPNLYECNQEQPEPVLLMKMVKKFAKEVKRILGSKVAEISIYGSLAKGTWSVENSDIDMLILVHGDPHECSEIVFKALQNLYVDLLCNEIVIQPIFYNVDVWGERVKRGSIFPSNVEEEKMVILK